MPKTIAFAGAVAAMTSLVPAGATALPLAQGKAAAGASDMVVLVREGCGRGFQYSMRFRRCVPDTPRAQYRDFRRDTYRCGPGLMWADRLRRCVWAR